MNRDAGHAPVEVALAIGLLLLPVAIGVLSFGPWLETRVTAEAAAAEAARSAVLATDLEAGNRVVTELTANHGLALEDVRVGWCGAQPEPKPAGSCSFGRGSVVLVEVVLWTPAISTPWGEIGGLWVSASHAEPVDLYRSIG